MTLENQDEIPQESNPETQSEPQAEQPKETSFFRSMFTEIWKDKLGNTINTLWKHLKTTGYVFAKPAILIDDEADEGLDDHVSYSMSTLSVTAFLIVIFSLLGVESHTSYKTISHKSDDTSLKFGRIEYTDSVYIGGLKNGQPHGTGLLRSFTNNSDTIVVSDFIRGHLSGPGFKFGNDVASKEVLKIYDGEPDSGFHKVAPFMALFIYLIALLVYTSILSWFRGVYDDLPDSYLKKGAIFYFNAIFFLFIIGIMSFSLAHGEPDNENDFLIIFLFLLAPIYYFLRLGKVKRSRILQFLFFLGFNFIYMLFSSLLVGLFMFGSGILN